MVKCAGIHHARRSSRECRVTSWLTYMFRMTKKSRAVQLDSVKRMQYNIVLFLPDLPMATKRKGSKCEQPFLFCSALMACIVGAGNSARTASQSPQCTSKPRLLRVKARPLLLSKVVTKAYFGATTTISYAETLIFKIRRANLAYLSWPILFAPAIGLLSQDPSDHQCHFLQLLQAFDVMHTSRSSFEGRGLIRTKDNRIINLSSHVILALFWNCSKASRPFRKHVKTAQAIMFWAMSGQPAMLSSQPSIKIL